MDTPTTPAARPAPSPAEIALLAGGAVVVVGSFLDFGGTTNAWGSGSFPIATLLPLYALLVAVPLALTMFAKATLPAEVLGLSWPQWRVGLAAMNALMAIGWLLVGDLEIGFWLMALGIAAQAYGAIAAPTASSH